MEFLKEFRRSPLKAQQEESDRLRNKHPDRVPVLVDRLNVHAPRIDKNRYLVPVDLTLGQFLVVLRRRIKLTPEKALFVFNEAGRMPPTGVMMSDIYREHASANKFLVLTYSLETTFG